MKRGIIFFIFSLFYFSSLLKAQELKTAADNDKFWKERFKHLPEFKKTLKKYKKYRLEIIYTQIDRNDQNDPSFVQYHYGDKESYFYPASTVKLPMAIYTLEKLYNNSGSMEHQLVVKKGTGCGEEYKNEYYTYYRSKKDETFGYIAHKFHKPLEYFSKLNPRIAEDSVLKENSLILISAAPSKISVREIITEMLVFSSNDAYNKLFEFCTPEFINARLKETGYIHAGIYRRLLKCINAEWDNKSAGYAFYSNDTMKLKSEGIIQWENEFVTYPEKGIDVGKKYLDGDQLIRSPKNFDKANVISLSELHLMLLRLVFMENIPEKKKFMFSRFEQRFLLRMLGLYSRELERVRDITWMNVEDGYANFIMDGNNKENIPPHIRIINIMGQAYGFTTDCAYIFDTKNKIEFMLSVRIYTNNDNILNDDKYEYDEIALPLMEALGKEIHAYEIQRKREVVPNLNYFYSLFK
ncbi:MAG: serine hydrolase [Bacteroidota bacterium]